LFDVSLITNKTHEENLNFNQLGTIVGLAIGIMILFGASVTALYYSCIEGSSGSKIEPQQANKEIETSGRSERSERSARDARTEILEKTERSERSERSGKTVGKLTTIILGKEKTKGTGRDPVRLKTLESNDVPEEMLEIPLFSEHPSLKSQTEFLDRKLMDKSAKKRSKKIGKDYGKKLALSRRKYFT